LEIKIGVLALQGDFREHISAIKKCGYEADVIKFPHQLSLVDGLIIPGGESTTMAKLIKKYDFKPALDTFFKNKKPIFGTCAGLILLAEKTGIPGLNLKYIDIDVERNAYGRQVDSFEQKVKLYNGFINTDKDFNAIFIRAPKIIRIGKSINVLSSVDDNIILARHENVLVCSFHPELTDDLRIHMYFMDMVKESVNMIQSTYK